MDSPIPIDTIRMGLSIIYLKGSQVKISKFDVFQSLKTVLTSAISSGSSLFAKVAI